MPTTTRRWLSRLAWVLPACLLLYVAIGALNQLWFRTQMPVGFYDANWSGTWQTRNYGNMSGKLVVRLPDPLPQDVEFKVEALVYYPIYSVWKTGQFVKMDFIGHFSPNEATSAGQSTNEIPGKGGGKLSFKGSTDGQVVEYSALIDESRTRIVGGYLSTNPYDYGHFAVRYY